MCASARPDQATKNLLIMQELKLMALSDKNNFYSHCSRNPDEICFMYIFFLLEFDANGGTLNIRYTMHVEGIHSDYEIYLMNAALHLQLF